MNRTLLAIFLFLGTYLNGQIRGTVFDDKKEPIIGASVRVVLNGELSNIGTVTDFDGAWSLDIFNYPVQVEVNSMGFATQRVVIQNASPIRITLKPDRNVLKEVSVVQQRLSEQQEKI